jgi:hypothetical protein
MRNSTGKTRNIASPRLLNVVTRLIFMLFAMLVIRYQINLLSYIEWADESETIVTAKMIVAGSTLYSQIFNHHGPLTFLPGILLENFGSFGVPEHRISIVILQLLALLAIYFSPLLKDRLVSNIYTGLAASVMLLYLPEIFGHTYIYQVMAGLLLIIILAQYTLPAIACPEGLSANKIIIGNLLIGSLPFLAITYLPISALLFAASVRNQFLLKSFASLATGILFNLLFLACIGSIPGYLAFHLYLNAEVLPLYNGGRSASHLIHSAFSSATNDLSQFSIFTAIAIAIAKLASDERGLPWRSMMVGTGIGSLLIRGGHFHALPYFYASLALPLIFFKNQIRPRNQSILVMYVLLMICLVKLSFLLPADMHRLSTRQIPKATEFSRFARLFTSKQDRIIAYSHQNFHYIAADRLPASGHFFYLPWQEKYNENPKFGIKIDACQEIDKYRPKIMLIDKWTVWDKYPWDSYAGCVQKIIDSHYTRIPDRPYYVRKDLLADDMGIATTHDSYYAYPGAQPDAGSPIRMFMTSSHRHEQTGLKRIGVKFGRYVSQNPADAELRLNGPDGSALVQRFSLTDRADDTYRYFELDSKRYTSGEISTVTGSGVSTWESHSENGDINTCIIYEYNDGKRRFTPGCPFF